jgi:hypothetical protein
MADVEVDAPAPVAIFNNVVPKDIAAEAGNVKLFNRWSFEDVDIRDISLTYVDNPPVLRVTCGVSRRSICWAGLQERRLC